MIRRGEPGREGRARAPGKLVLSGAYAVLRGAPALVTAVDRFVVADTGRPAALVTPEVRAAIGDAPAPWFDASELRDEGRKLGLGSSAAILVASLGALALRDGAAAAGLGEALLARAAAAHRAAQGGGSGIDVAASALGGVLRAESSAGEVTARRVRLPAGLDVEVWASSRSVATSGMLRAVEALSASDPTTFERRMGAQRAAAERAAAAVDAADRDALLAALAEQGTALAALGDAAGVPIVDELGRFLSSAAAAQGGAFLPSGAGGGDVSIHVAPGPSTPALRRLAEAGGLSRLPLAIGAPGVEPAA
ncbi:MAG: hypothetical protein IT376_04655 [Polyangiaceae bacterium]|nr:hypothetical protein [Polyangiaceae bacterium]